jgi:hypothetical protein
MIVLEFPERGPFTVTVRPEESAWLIIARDHSWLHGSRPEALANARTIAEGFGVAVELMGRPQ